MAGLSWPPYWSSSFIEAAIDEKIQSMSIASWRDSDMPSTLGDRADYLWHVRERLISLGLVAPHLMTFEEQEIWATISEHGHFWRGRWTREGDLERWVWSRDDSSILRDRVEEWWETIVKVAHGDLDRTKLPRLETRPAKGRDLDDEVPF